MKRLKEICSFYLYMIINRMELIISLFFTIVSLFLSIMTFSWQNYNLAIYSIFSLFASIGSFIYYFCDLFKINPPKNREYYIDIKDYVNVKFDKHSKIEFKDIYPSCSYQSHGFNRVESFLISGEVSFNSKSLDKWLFLNQPIIKYKYSYKNMLSYVRYYILGKYKCKCLCLGDEFKDNSLKYLKAKVDNKNVTNNDLKIRIVSRIFDKLDSIIIEKTRYYDSIICAESLRSIISYRNKGTDKHGTKNEIFDFTKYFPICKESGMYRIDDESIKKHIPHVGVSMLVITKDNYPIFFKQSIHNEQMSGKLVVSGSGSSDYSDIKNCKSSNFLDVVKYSMCREFSEEGKQELKNNKIMEYAKSTYIIGYFEWLNRCCKPEFLGVARLDINKSDVEPDCKEVIEYDNENLLYINKFKITDICDFEKLFKEINDKEYSIGLSSYMVIWRLYKISTGDEDQKNKLKSVLKL